MNAYVLLGYLILYLWAAFLWRSWTVWRQTGINPFVLTRNDDAHGYVGKAFAVSIALIALVVIVNAFRAEIFAYYFAPMIWLQTPWIRGLGWVLLIVSLTWIVLAQKQMGASWRIGIPQGESTRSATSLVTTGVFSRSRNPIFLGMAISLAGFFLVLPNALSLVALVLGFVLMQIQIRLEETYLFFQHGEAYQAYCAQVRRWL